MKHIVTHNGIFHADEVTAIALIEVFVDEEVTISRVPHNSEDLDSFDMVIDIGKKYDGVKFFDHHQYKGGKSSAGLIWSYINKRYPKIEQFVRLVDMHDTGVKQATLFEFPSLISTFNTQKIYAREQDKAFLDALSFTKKILLSYKNMQETQEAAKDIIEKSSFFNSTQTVLELSTYTPHWKYYINEEKTPHIKAVVWEDNKKYKLQLIPKHTDTFQFSIQALQQDKDMDFVHSNGFFAIADNKNIMQKFIEKNSI